MNSVDNNNETIPLHNKAWSLCKNFLGGSWNNLEENKMYLKELSGGLSNHIYYCSLPKEIKPRKYEPTEVLLRIYGRNNANNEVDNVIFTLLSERQLGPKLFGVFPEGRLEEYIPSRSMYSNEIRDPNFSETIAKKIAKVHGMDIPIKKDPSFLADSFKGYLRQLDRIVLDNITDPDQREIAQRVLSWDLVKEVDWLIEYLDRRNSPVVFCHNDLQIGNILVRNEQVENKEDQIMIIDYEFAAYSYRAFDLANHFLEWMFDYTNKDFPYYYFMKDKFPSRESQMNFFYTYIKSMEQQVSLKSPCKKKNRFDYSDSNCQQKCSLEQQANILYNEVQHFLLGPHLLWALWGITQSDNENISFGYWEYADDRLNEYFEIKNNLNK